MAEQPYIERSTDLIIWAQLAAGDTGAPYYLPPMRGPITAFQVTGISGHTVALQGTIDGTTWAALQDRLGSDIAMTANGIVEVSTAVLAIRPSVASGTGTVTVYMRSQS